jgi:hypothetical protein
MLGLNTLTDKMSKCQNDEGNIRGGEWVGDTRSFLNGWETRPPTFRFKQKKKRALPLVFILEPSPYFDNNTQVESLNGEA